jgi:hypothetical protein
MAMSGGASRPMTPDELERTTGRRGVFDPAHPLAKGLVGMWVPRPDGRWMDITKSHPFASEVPRFLVLRWDADSEYWAIVACRDDPDAARAARDYWKGKGTEGMKIVRVEVVPEPETWHDRPGML